PPALRPGRPAGALRRRGAAGAAECARGPHRRRCAGTPALASRQLLRRYLRRGGRPLKRPPAAAGRVGPVGPVRHAAGFPRQEVSMANPIVIIHGWSDDYGSFRKLRDFISSGLGVPATILRLGDWI